MVRSQTNKFLHIILKQMEQLVPAFLNGLLTGWKAICNKCISIIHYLTNGYRQLIGSQEAMHLP